MRAPAFALVTGLACSCAGASASQATGAQRYLCTVAEKAGIEANHLEDGGAPQAFVEDDLPTRFKIEIAPVDGVEGQFTLDEIDYSGPDRDRREYASDKSVLHSTYSGDGKEFASDTDQSFFVLGETARANVDGILGFFHSGWEYPGGEDTILAVRWGRCKPSS